MNIKGNGRSALILAAGLWVCFAGPSQAAPGRRCHGRKLDCGDTDCTQQIHQAQLAPLEKLRPPQIQQGGAKSTDADDKKAAATDAVAADADKSATRLNPQHPATRSPTPTRNWPPPTRRPASAQAMSVRANDIVQTAPEQSG